MSKNLSTEYYREIKKGLQKKYCKRCQSFSKEKKKKKRQYYCEQYKNLSEYEKNKLVEHRENIK